MGWFLRIGTVVAIALATLPAHAASKAANAVIQKTIRESCGGPGRLDPRGLVERDLTGDGEDDLLINYGFISCQDGVNGFCGSAGCSVSIHVRENGRLVQKADLFGAETQVIDGNPPRIRIFDGDGASRTLRWKGGRFR